MIKEMDLPKSKSQTPKDKASKKQVTQSFCFLCCWQQHDGGQTM
jgi:hypothetical protein